MVEGERPSATESEERKFASTTRDGRNYPYWCRCTR